MRVLLLLLALAACGPTGGPGSTYPFAGDHPLIRLDQAGDVFPQAVGATVVRNVEAVVVRVDPCPQAGRVSGACVTDTVTLVAGPSDAGRLVLPAESPAQFAVGARYRVTLAFSQGDDSVSISLRGCTRL